MSVTAHVNNQSDDSDFLKVLLERFNGARRARGPWETLWQECYDYTLPQRGGFMYQNTPGARRMEKIYDATGMDAVDQLAASLLGNLTPTWSQWFGLKPGPDLSPEEAEKLSPVLEKAARTIQDHFDQSNFAVEIHQCYLDLIVGGTASLYFEEAEPGGFSAFRFSAVPLTNIVLEESESGFLDAAYRILSLTYRQISERYPLAELPADVARSGTKDPQATFKIMEAVMPEGLIYRYFACLMEQENDPVLLATGQFEHSPFISFR